MHDLDIIAHIFRLSLIMPRLATSITLSELYQLRKEGVFAIGHVPNLCVRVSAIGNKRFIFRYKFESKPVSLVLGVFDEISLDEAILRAKGCSKFLHDGHDPKLFLKYRRLQCNEDIQSEIAYMSLKQGKVNQPQEHHITVTQKTESTTESKPKKDKTYEPTLAEAVTRYVLYLQKSEKYKDNPKAYNDKIRRFEMHIFPKLRLMKLSDIKPSHINDSLSVVWQRSVDLGQKLYSDIINFFKWALASDLYTEVAFKHKLDALMESYKHNKLEPSHYPALDYKRIPELFLQLRNKNTIGAYAYQFAVLTATRSKAVRNLKWSQIDFDEKIWNIPIENDKLKKKDRLRSVFLSEEAIRVLHEVRQLLPDKEYVFTSRRADKPLSDNTFNKIIDDINNTLVANGQEPFVDNKITNSNSEPRNITIHGTARASFKVWSKSDELGNHRLLCEEAVELCLLHERRDPLKGAYDRSTFDIERRKVMDLWGQYCFSKIDNRL